MGPVPEEPPRGLDVARERGLQVRVELCGSTRKFGQEPVGGP
jgi:hypothetical protein